MSESHTLGFPSDYILSNQTIYYLNLFKQKISFFLFLLIGQVLLYFDVLGIFLKPL